MVRVMGVLHCGYSHIAPIDCGIGAALDKVKARHGWQAHDFIKCQDLGRFHHAIDHQAMLGWIDVPPALVMAFKMQAAWRDDAKQRLQRRERNGGLRGLRQPRALAALHTRFILRWFAVAVVLRNTLAQTHTVCRQGQNIRVATFHRQRIGLRQGSRHCSTGSCRGKRIPNEVATPFFTFSKNGPNPILA